MSHELLGHDAIVAEFLESSRKTLTLKTFEGDKTIDKHGRAIDYDYLTKWEWMSAMCTAIGILNDAISQICLDKETYDA